MTRTPLENLKVLELAGPATAPFAGLVLADYGADVVRVDRPTEAFGPQDTLCRGKRSVIVDLKAEASRKAFICLADVADIIIDPYRPGVMDRLGAGSAVLCQRNPRLIYAHIYGFRPDNSSIYAQRAGHDINYLAVSGVLSLFGRKDEVPAPPANILADFAGGGLVCVVGILLAVLQRSLTGRGQVVSANMTDGTSFLATFARQQLSTPNWNQPRGHNLLDGGAPFYEVYETLDGRYMAVGAQESRFYRTLLEGLGLDYSKLPDQWDRKSWPTMKRIFEDKFRLRTQAAWRTIFDHTDSCVTPVLSTSEIEKPLQPLVALSECSNPRIELQEPFPLLQKGSGAAMVLSSWLGTTGEASVRVDKHSGILYQCQEQSDNKGMSRL
ncbi:hypothetical protein LTR84_010260 [Exophiala bonariae]|uniref:Alpha-methylacyl-CoA racemase n=1 Tax=Exophiala bonariae TaxID=1690606 RepID=A0AAV9MU37_9EURO|nr:hypothetical protein LTR84_010260 [Exophiala bonariae]